MEKYTAAGLMSANRQKSQTPYTDELGTSLSDYYAKFSGAGS